MIDVICSEVYRKCRKSDCRPRSNLCFDKHQFDAAHVWIECGKIETCKKHPQFCNSFSDRSVVAEFVPIFFRMMDVLMSTRTPSEDLALALFRKNFNLILESSLNNANCTGEWKSNHKSDTNGGDTTLWDPKSNCDATKETYTVTKVEVVLDSFILVVVVIAIFTVATMVFGNFEVIQFKFTAVRTGCFVASLLVSLLVYVGATH